jgi:DNA replication protein DnaC
MKFVDDIGFLICSAPKANLWQREMTDRRESEKLRINSVFGD